MMASIRSKDTKPEIFVRKALHAQGLRYRLGGYNLLGKPDIVFPSRKALVFVNGCFWHKHECSQFKWPSTNKEFWFEKLNSNAKRDFTNQKILQSMGWQVFIIWECELKATKYDMPNDSVLRIVKELEVKKKDEENDLTPVLFHGYSD